MYSATQKSWKIKISHVQKSNIRIACSVYRGIIRDVFEIYKWIPSSEAKGRYMFEGKRASDQIRQKYLSKSVIKFWKKGSQNPIKYAILTK